MFMKAYSTVTSSYKISSISEHSRNYTGTLCQNSIYLVKYHTYFSSIMFAFRIWLYVVTEDCFTVSASYARNELDSGAAYSLAKAGYQQF
jgi:hypothetical protein